MLFVLHVQWYAPHVVQHNGDSESISHMPVIYNISQYSVEKIL